jgi:hypothetical protein
MKQADRGVPQVGHVRQDHSRYKRVQYLCILAAILLFSVLASVRIYDFFLLKIWLRLLEFDRIHTYMRRVEQTDKPTHPRLHAS